MPRRIKSFYCWAVENQPCYRNMGIYDLISDMKQDEYLFPRSSDYQRNRQYLEKRGACDSCLDCFEQAWRDYYIEIHGEPWVEPNEEEDENNEHKI